MAGGSRFVWIPFLLSCVFQASDNRHVQQEVIHLKGCLGNPEVDDILSKIPITLPEGIDPRNINVTSITSKTCTGMKEQLAHLNVQYQQTTHRISQLDDEAFGLRGDVRLLKLQLATCSSTASAIAGSYQTQLLSKMNQLLGTLDSETFLIMKIIALTREVNSLQRKVQHAASGTGTNHTRELLREQQEKRIELSLKTQQMERNNTNAALSLQIISLQNQIWDLDQAELRRGDLQPNKTILALQEQLDRKISELRGKADAHSAVLELISVNSKIAALQRLINVHIEESRTNAADYERQWRQKVELLKGKILQLNRDDRNKELTKDILIMQSELEHFRQLMMNAKKTTDSKLKELRVILGEEKKKEGNLQKHLEEADYSQAQLIIKIISIMKEARELDGDEQHQTSTSTSQTTSLQTLLQAKEKELAKAQAEINELQRKLRLKSEECPGLEERYQEVKTDLEQKIAELNRTGDSKAALILNVINLHEDLKTLRDLISTTEDPDKISELQRQLEKKQDELNSKTAQIERRIPNPKILLLIIKLQKELWDLEKNETTGGRVEELQSRVDGLISEIDDKEDDNTKRILKILTLQSQVERLQRQVLQTTQVAQLTNELTTKKDELQKYVNDLNEKNPANAQLILTITDLQNQLRKLEKERHNEGQTASAAVTKLREQLTAKVEEHSRDQAEINALQNKLNQTKAQCSGFDRKLDDLQNDLDVKVKELQSDSVTSLALQVSTLTLQLEELKRRLQNTVSEAKINEQKLQKMIDEKNNELTKKTAELKARSAQPYRLLQIISIQTEIEKLVNVAADEINYDKIRARQDHLNYLIDGIQDENNENTKLMFKILAQQDEIARLEKQEKSQTQAALERIKDLEDDLEQVRNQITEETSELDSSDAEIANLSAQIMELHKKIKPLEDEISDLKETSDENVRELQKTQDLTKRQLQDSELLLKDADAKNFNQIMEIADLRTQLKKAQKQASQAADNNIDELKQLLQTQQRENKRLRKTNKDLKQEVKELKMCCADVVNTQCDDLQRQLQQSQEDADRLQQQLHKKEATLKQLQRDLEGQSRENNTREYEYSNLERQLQQIRDDADYLKQQLSEKDAALDQLQQELEEQSRKNNKLQEDYDSLQNEKNKLEDSVQELQNKLRDVEDKTISARQMTFDPNTAHPRIALSAGNTEMNTSDVIQDVPDHPGRFDLSLAILGATGFSTGRHYWEVSVAGRLCYHLGMASESSQRKGAITFNPTNGFWTIVLNRHGQYKAFDRRVVGIPVRTRPLTLGILLDYKKGQVSFFDAGAKSHMYSFVGQRFTGKIYPFINFCVADVESQTPIVSLSPGLVDWTK